MISIILTVVENRGTGWLDASIQSALNQDYDGEYEIILASDGNPDMQKYASKYKIRYILAPKGNQSTNFNSGVSIAKGSFLKPLHDDDILTPNCLKDLRHSIIGHDLVHANAINFQGDGEGKKYKPPWPADFNKLLKKGGSYIHAATIMFRKDTFLKVGGYDEKLIYSEDYDFYLNLLSKGYAFVHCNEVVVRYRKHPKQLSYIPKTPRRMRDRNYIISKYKKQ